MLQIKKKKKNQKTTQEKNKATQKTLMNKLQRANNLNYFFGYLSIKSINILI